MTKTDTFIGGILVGFIAHMIVIVLIVTFVR